MGSLPGTGATPNLPGRAQPVLRKSSPPARFAWLRSHPELLGVTVLFSLAFLARFIGLASAPPNLSREEADWLRLVFPTLAGRGGPTLLGFDQSGASYLATYFAAIAVRVFGFTIAAARLPSAFLGSLALMPLYLLAREHLSVKASLLVLFAAASSLWLLQFSRSSWPTAEVCLFALLAGWSLRRGVVTTDRTRYRYFALAGISCGLAAAVEPTGWTVALSLAAYAPFAFRDSPSRAETVATGYLVTVTIALLLFAGVLVGSQGDFGRLAGHSVGAATESAQAGGSPSSATSLLRVGRAARAVLFLDGSAVADASALPPGRPLMDAASGLLFAVGLVLGLRAVPRLALWWCLLLTPLIAVLATGSESPDPRALVVVAPVMLLFAGYAFDRIAERGGTSRRALQLVALVIVGLSGIGNLATYASWANSPEAASARQPAVEIDDFALWQTLQRDAAGRGEAGFPAAKWPEVRGQYVKDQPAARAAEPNSAPPMQAGALPDLFALDATLGAGSLTEPRGVAADASGGVYVADAAARQIVRLDESGRVTSRLGKPGSGDGEFDAPWDVAVDKQGRIYVLDALQGTVQRFGAQGEFQGKFLAREGLYRPRGLAVGPDGTVYVADTGRNRIVKMSPDGSVLAVLGGATGQAGLEQPTDIALDSAGNLLVVEPAAKRLQKLDPAGNQLAVWGFSASDTQNAPHLAVAGEVLLATDPAQKRLLTIAIDGAAAGYWRPAASDDSQFASPFGVAADSNGHVYIADSGAGKVFRLTLRN